MAYGCFQLLIVVVFNLWPLGSGGGALVQDTLTPKSKDCSKKNEVRRIDYVLVYDKIQGLYIGEVMIAYSDKIDCLTL